MSIKIGDKIKSLVDYNFMPINKIYEVKRIADSGEPVIIDEDGEELSLTEKTEYEKV